MKTRLLKNYFCLYLLVLCVPSCQVPKSSPLIDAARSGNISEAEKLIGTCLLVNEASSNLETPLHVAAQLGHDEMVVWLLAHDADPSLMNKKGKTAYDLAYQSGQVDSAFIIVNYLDTLEREKEFYELDDLELLGFMLNIYDHRRLDLLHYLSEVGDTNKLRSILDRSENINIQTESGKTPLHFSIINSQIDATKLLLEKGANPNIGDMNNKTPLYYAVEKKDLDAAAVLLEYRGDPLIKSFCDNESALDLAKRLGDNDIFSCLEAKKC